MNDFYNIQSELDASVNFVAPASVGFFEARYVRRERRYFSLYLSSQTGCAQACRMCHLTATKQTQLVNATLRDYKEQAQEVFAHYATQPHAEFVHYNFMARGEAFANPEFLDNPTEILTELGELAIRRHLVPRFLISTIIPASIAGVSLAHLFPLVTPEIYYSLYSTSETFRAKWLPKAAPVAAALQMLREYQDAKRIVPKLHWAFIKGENDSVQDVVDICNAVKHYGLQANLAIVRYNPYDATFGEESDDCTIDRNQKLMQEMLPGARVKKITRVGMDVAASCGMFVGKDGKA
jgi:23S rRNA (adenine2503-C2)-methyltransferase